MQELLKLLFDLSVYYTVIGFYGSMLLQERPSGLGFVLLLLTVAADALCRRFHRERLSRLFLALPLLFLLVRPGVGQCIFLLPPWVYLGWSLWTDRVFTDYKLFSEHFFLGMKLLLLLLFGVILWKFVAFAVSCTVPYLVILLFAGVCLLRMLREDHPGGLRQCILITVFLSVCVGFTIGKVPQLLLRGIGLVYSYLLVPVLLCVLIGVAFLFSFGVELIRSLLQGKSSGIQAQSFSVMSAAEQLGIDSETVELVTGGAWLRTILILLGTALVVAILFLVFRALAGTAAAKEMPRPFSEETERFTPLKRRSSPKRLLRPADPRMAVRYYFAKYRRECLKREKILPEGATAQELAAYCADAFPGADAARLLSVYSPARYSRREVITAAQADEAEKAWRDLKAARAPEK